MIMHFMQNIKLKNKIAAASIVLVLLSTLLLALFFFRYVSTEISNAAYSNSSDMSVQMSNYFNEKLKSPIQRVYAMRASDQFNSNSYLTKILLDDQTFYYSAAFSELSGMLSEIRMSDSFIDSVYIYTPKGDFYDLARLKQKYLNVVAFASIGRFYENVYEIESSFKEAEEALSYNFSQQSIPVNNYEDICLQRDMAFFKRPIEIEGLLALHAKLCEKQECKRDIDAMFEYFKAYSFLETKRIKMYILELVMLLSRNIEEAGGKPLDAFNTKLLSAYEEIQT